MASNQSTLTLARNVRLVEGRHGHFFVLSTDTYIGRSLAAYGEWTESEFSVIRRLLKAGDNVIDIGANIGSHTVPLAKLVAPGGLVLAFEPQPRIFQLLAANVTINGLSNVRLYQFGCSDQPGSIRFPDLNYNANNNYGGVKLTAFPPATGNGRETTPPDRSYAIQLVTLDDTCDIDRVALIKIDVEGMELSVLRGADRIIRRLRPVLFVENEFAENSEPLLQHLSALEYDLYWHVASIFDPRNFRGNAENLFANIACVNVLCIPRERKIEIRGLRKIANLAEHPRRKP